MGQRPSTPEGLWPEQQRAERERSNSQKKGRQGVPRERPDAFYPGNPGLTGDSAAGLAPGRKPTDAAGAPTPDRAFGGPETRTLRARTCAVPGMRVALHPPSHTAPPPAGLPGLPTQHTWGPERTRRRWTAPSRSPLFPCHSAAFLSHLLPALSLTPSLVGGVFHTKQFSDASWVSHNPSQV